MSFTLLAHSQGKLWIIECVYLDVQTRRVFTDSILGLLYSNEGEL